LRLLTDYDRSLWLDRGDQWVGLTGEIFDVKAFGAVADGVTDDWPAFHAALDAMTSASNPDSTSPFGRTLYVPPGTYRTVQRLDPPVRPRHHRPHRRRRHPERHGGATRQRRRH
jgi:hypothetical protein